MSKDKKSGLSLKKTVAMAAGLLVLSAFTAIPVLRAEENSSNHITQKKTSAFSEVATALLVDLPTGLIGDLALSVESFGLCLDKAGLPISGGGKRGKSILDENFSNPALLLDVVSWSSERLLMEAREKNGDTASYSIAGKVIDQYADVLVKALGAGERVADIMYGGPAAIALGHVVKLSAHLQDEPQGDYVTKAGDYVTQNVPQMGRNLLHLPVDLPCLALDTVGGIAQSIEDPFAKAGKALCNTKVGWVPGKLFQGVSAIFGGVRYFLYGTTYHTRNLFFKKTDSEADQPEETVAQRPKGPSNAKDASLKTSGPV